MGIDYDGKGAFGIEFMDGEIGDLINPYEIDGVENPNYNDDFEEMEFVEEMEGLEYFSFGNSYNGNECGVLFYPENLPRTLPEFIEKAPELYKNFLEVLASYGIHKTMDDIKFYNEWSAC